MARATIPIMTEQLESIVAALEKGQATAEQQREAARLIRDLDHEVRELQDLEERA